MRKLNASLRLHLAAGVAATALITAHPAAAQSAPAPIPAADSDTADKEGPIIVTGSRVATNGNDQPTPVTVVTTERLLQTNPSSITAALQTLPIFQGMRTPTTAPGNSRQNNAARVLNLRNLGRLRTLALFDGHRLAPSSPEAETDVAFIPSMLVERVDVVTGGASAVYGSDAVSGVVNFITNRHFNGVKFDAHYGISDRGDGREFKVGAAAGTDLFGGRGHIEASYEYLDSPGIESKLSRDFGAQVYTVQGQGTTAVPYIYVANTRLNSTSFNGYITLANNAATNPLRDMVFSSNGVLTPFQHGAPVVSGTTTISGVEIGGDGGFYNKTMLEAAASQHVGFARFDYDLSDTVHFYSSGSLWFTANRNTNVNNGFNNIIMSAGNAFLAPQYRTQLSAAGVTSFRFSRLFDNEPPQDSQTKTDGHMLTVGLDGELGGGFKWEAFYANSRNQQHTWANFNINNYRALAALDAVFDSSNQVVCRVTLTNPGLYPGCVPLNLFGPTAQSAAAMHYIADRTEYRATTWMDEVGASIAGPLFDTWAGPVQAALSGEYRSLRYQQISSAEPVPASCTGLNTVVANCTANTLLYSGNVLASGPKVRQAVTEGAIELDVPLLKDSLIARALSVNGAARYTHYDTSGSVTTWKVGLNWHLTDDLRIRATRSREIRAPNLNELFSPRLTQTTASIRDTHTNLITPAPLITDPNPNLKPEIAQVWTAGIVYTPPFVPGLSLAVDGYKISINNAITAIQGQDTNIQKICEDSNGTSEYCSLIVRPLAFSDRTAANIPTAWLSQPRNALKLETWGVDFELNYHAELAGGAFTLRGLMSYQPHYKLTLPFYTVPLDAAGAGIGPCCQLDGLSKWRGTLFLGYKKNGFSLDLQERWLSGVRWDPNPALVFAVPDRPGVAYTNITAGFEIADHYEFYFAVQNLFDRQPTPWGRTSHSGLPGLMGGFVPGQDVIGRYFTTGVRLKF